MSDPTTTENEKQSEEIKRIKANDEHALRTLYTSNYSNVEKYVLNNSGTQEDAKDIYQEAFVTTWRNIMLDKFTVTREGSVNGYLFRVAKHKWLDMLRARKRQNISIVVADEELADGTPYALTTEEEDYVEKVKLHFGTMGEPCKELLRRFYYEQESLKQLAARFSWTEATAKNNKYRCLQKLRAAILNNKHTQ